VHPAHRWLFGYQWVYNMRFDRSSLCSNRKPVWIPYKLYLSPFQRYSAAKSNNNHPTIDRAFQSRGSLRIFSFPVKLIMPICYLSVKKPRDPRFSRFCTIQTYSETTDRRYILTIAELCNHYLHPLWVHTCAFVRLFVTDGGETKTTHLKTAERCTPTN